MNDLRSLPDRVLRLYTLPVAVWGLAIMGLWWFERAGIALSACYGLALWFIGLTAWWGRSVLARFDADELAIEEVEAGARSVARIVAPAGLLPGFVFLATDPFSVEAWGTVTSTVLVTWMAWFGSQRLIGRRHRMAGIAGLTVALAALPINTTGAVSMSFWLGWFEPVVHAVEGL